MENEFNLVMSKRNDKDLIKIVTTDKEKYTSKALEAAESEVKKRNIDISEFQNNRESGEHEDIIIEPKEDLNYLEVMSHWSDKELIKVITIDRNTYNDLAIAAAEELVRKREISSLEVAKTSERSKVQQKKTQQIEKKTVDSGLRSINFIIDYIVCQFIQGLLYFVYILIAKPNEYELNKLHIWLSFIVIYVSYYIITEYYFQKSLGKHVTETKVIKVNGDKLEMSDVVTRTFSRLIPFDALSYMFTRNGIHDYISKTTVVKDSVKKKY